LAGVVIVTFVLTHVMPVDPAAYYAGPAATAESVAQVRHMLALDRPLPIQFLNYVMRLLHGDLGTALSSGQPVITDLAQRLPASLELTAVALLFAIVVALPMGVVAAIRPGSIVDHICSVVVSFGAALPTFFVGLVLVYIFYYLLDIAPEPLGRLNEIYYTIPPSVTGFYLIDTLLNDDIQSFYGAATQLILPSISLGLTALAPIARITRASMLAALGSDYIRTARALGLSTNRVVLGYAFRNALTQIVSMLGLVFAGLLGANVLVEQVFGWPGVGAYALRAAIASDYAAVQGFVFIMAMIYISLNFAVDLLNSALDPRGRLNA
jgi:peptide/nickel transport system permease protein